MAITPWLEGMHTYIYTYIHTYIHSVAFNAYIQFVLFFPSAILCK